MRDKSISYARKRIEKQLELQEKERKRRLQYTRLELARAGISAYQRRKLTEAVKNFHAYIRILEEMKEVSEGGLLPTHFDVKKDSHELLMISGVYWDLAKLYDRTHTPEKYKEFVHYIQKYIEFSRGMPFQHLCAEAVRKYLSGEKPVHREDFKNAYKILSVHQCFIVGALSEELPNSVLFDLRSFRDEVLVRSQVGNQCIRLYYRVGPEIGIYLARAAAWEKRALAQVVVVGTSLINQFFNHRKSRDGGE